jgi:hypothetical protein
MSICERHAAGQVSITMRTTRTLSLTVADDVLTSIPVSNGFVDVFAESVLDVYDTSPQNNLLSNM